MIKIKMDNHKSCSVEARDFNIRELAKLTCLAAKTIKDKYGIPEELTLQVLKQSYSDGTATKIMFREVKNISDLVPDDEEIKKPDIQIIKENKEGDTEDDIV